MPSCKKCLSNAKIKQQIFAKHSIDREIQRKKTHTRQMNKARLNMNAVSHSIHSAYFLFINEPAFCSSSFGLTRRYHCLSSLITIRNNEENFLIKVEFVKCLCFHMGEFDFNYMQPIFWQIFPTDRIKSSSES